MEPKMLKETIKLVFDKLAQLLNNIFPGIVILELFFKKGYFSGIPTTLSEFILYIVWAIVLSTPYNFLHPYPIENFYDNLIRRIAKNSNKNPTEILQKNENDELEDFRETTVFGFILCQLTITYISLKFITHCLVISPIIGIPVVMINLFISVTIAIILGFPISYIYAAILEHFAIKYLKKSL